MPNGLESDLNRTILRRRDMQAYFDRSVDNGVELVCIFGNRCRSSVGGLSLAEGQLSHVGDHYDIRHDGSPIRVLIVPMQTGRDDQHVTIAQRAAQVETGKPISARPMPRTPHMDGTALALKTLLGIPLVKPDDLMVGSRLAHVFDCFAMHNSTLCSRLSGSAAGGGSREMYEMCVTHLREAIRILEPSIVVAQGWTKSGQSPSRSVARALRVALPGRGTCTAVDAKHGPVAFVAVVHPARFWSRPTKLFFEEVEPALREARRVALNG